MAPARTTQRSDLSSTLYISLSSQDRFTCVGLQRLHGALISYSSYYGLSSSSVSSSSDSQFNWQNVHKWRSACLYSWQVLSCLQATQWQRKMKHTAVKSITWSHAVYVFLAGSLPLRAFSPYVPLWAH